MMNLSSNVKNLIIPLNDFCLVADKVIDQSREILASQKTGCNLWTCVDVNEVNSVYIDIIKCISLLEQLAKTYANALSYSSECSPWDPRCKNKKSSYGCSSIDPHC